MSVPNPLSVTCRECSSAPGLPCISKHGGNPMRGFHTERKESSQAKLELNEALEVPCEVCLAKPHEPCVAKRTGKVMISVHEPRQFEGRMYAMHKPQKRANLDQAVPTVDIPNLTALEIQRMKKFGERTRMVYAALALTANLMGNDVALRRVAELLVKHDLDLKILGSIEEKD